MKSILVPVDFSDVTLKVVKAAIQLAKPFQSRITLMHVLELTPQILGIGPAPEAVPTPPAGESEESSVTEKLGRLEELVISVGLEASSVELQGAPVDLILAQAEKSRVDLIVLGSHSRGPLYHLFVGGVIEGLLKRARCPVLVVPLSEPVS
ncbi:MAG TPA: universal stress protein [Chthoniobacterales bacterium]|nr:universal stress protein [Chthoniobacterales bacterium]